MGEWAGWLPVSIKRPQGVGRQGHGFHGRPSAQKQADRHRGKYQQGLESIKSSHEHLGGYHRGSGVLATLEKVRIIVYRHNYGDDAS